ncbi:hypothetical protein [Thiohalomonas denitrificans]|uniref:hypothetical protein n=1 Tax=Thiohalomonas denitrificans TaxID=415747 RepID=UPI0026EE783A|nr:hypothetical protein [Thiohalomonas denitrificans]
MAILTHSAKLTGAGRTSIRPLRETGVLLALLVISILMGPCAMAMDSSMNNETGTSHPCMAGDDCHLFSVPVAGNSDKVLPSGPTPLPEAVLRSSLVPFPVEPTRTSFPPASSAATHPVYLVTRRLRL